MFRQRSQSIIFSLKCDRSESFLRREDRTYIGNLSKRLQAPGKNEPAFIGSFSILLLLLLSLILERCRPRFPSRKRLVCVYM